MTPASDVALESLIASRGFALVPANRMRPLLEQAGPLVDWDQFAASWDQLGLDTYMADGGRYRRRAFAVYSVESGGGIARQAHQPHYQGREYNQLNGGIERWFEPVSDAIGTSTSMTTILAYCRDSFGILAPLTRTWHVEVHQFRIEAQTGSVGKPTPEGMHRDGVDYVLVLLINRENIQSGTTTIADAEKRPLGSFTLTVPFDAALVDDSRVYHGVTPVVPVDATRPAYRDVLVVTFRKAAELT